MISSKSNLHAPRHIALIPDGNRRCAKRLMKRPWKGHEWGVSKVKKVFDWGSRLGIKTMKQLCDRIKYKRLDHKNITTFVKKLA